MDVHDLLLTALRASLVYFYLLLVVRLIGKREVGNASALDLIVAFILGEVTDEAIFGDVPVIKVFLAIAVVAAWHFINAWLSYRSKTIHRLTSAQPTVLIENGKFIEENLARERVNKDDVYSQMRMLSIDDIQEVKTATLEPNGLVSVIQEEWAKPVQKGDLPKQKTK